MEDSAPSYRKQLNEDLRPKTVARMQNDPENSASNHLEFHMNKLMVMAVICIFCGMVLPLQTTSLASSGRSGTTQDEQHHQHMNERGEQGMGFSQSTTSHHFLIQSTGGAIQVGVKDSKDSAGRDHIRMHLAHTAKAFATGDFDIPMFVHDTIPPGVPEMKKMRREITYSFEETPSGGQVLIRTSNPEALAAVHKFLRYQIEEHQTHDPEEAPSSK
jgi:hypothetical protein